MKKLLYLMGWPQIYFELYPDARSEWRWRSKSKGNHKILGVSSESYKNRIACELSAKHHNPFARIDYVDN